MEKVFVMGKKTTSISAKIAGGYYIKARRIKDSWIAHASPIVREVWDYLLREANHTDKKYDGFLVKRGQLFRTYREIRDDLSWKVGFRIERYHESSMKRAMKALMTEQMIELTSEPRGNLITIINYDYYQKPSNYERTDEQTNGRTGSEPTANRQRTPINKNEKNEKNENNNTLLARSASAHSEPTTDEDPNVFCLIPLVSNSFFSITEDHVQKFAELYPAVNIRQELRKIVGWNETNPKKRKTAKGILNHVNSWLAREQDRGGSKGTESKETEPKGMGKYTENNMIAAQKWLERRNREQE